MTQPLLNSGPQEYVEPESDLVGEIAELRQDFELMQKAMTQLRQQMSTMQRGLGVAAGEIPISEVSTPTAPNSRSTVVWESWKQKLGLNCGRIIEALLTHGASNSTQLSILTGIDRSNIPKSIYKLNQAGLLNKNGGVFSLKQI